MEHIGFIGLGHMGSHMAINLIKAGFVVHVYDVVPAAIQELKNAGAMPETSILELTKQSDVIISSVQTSQQVSDICLTDDGIFKNARPHLLYMDCSSIDISVTRTLHTEAAKYHVSMLDAPVSGGVAGAAAATLTIMVGGAEADFLRAKPILAHLGKTIIHAGSAGNGQAAKICNNLLLAISMIGVSEAFVLAKKLGLDQKTFFDISSNSSGQCWSMTSYCPVPGILANVPSSHEYQPGFMAKMMLKDLILAMQAAELAQSSTPLGSVAHKLYDAFVKEGNGEIDFSAIIKFIDVK
jgi:3-hydroxyisobutyrate dehydrogenase